MDKYINVPLKVQSIPQFYKDCADILEPKTTKEVNYDCRYIEVSEERFTVLEAYELERGHTKFDFNMLWLMAGPKVNSELKNTQVKIQEGFICEG